MAAPAEVYNGESIDYPWNRDKREANGDEVLAEVPLGDQIPEEVEKTAKEVTEALIAAETKPDEEPVKKEEPLQELKIDAEPVDAGTKIEIKTAPVELVPPSSAEKIPVNRDFEKALPVLEVLEPPAKESIVVKTEETEKPEASAEKEKIKATFEDIGRRVLDGWRKGTSIDEIVGGVGYAIEKYRKEAGDKSVDFFTPTILAFDTISSQLMIVEEKEKAGQEIKLMNSEDIENANIVSGILKDLPLLGDKYRDSLRDYIYILGERLDNRRSEDIVPAT